MMFWNSLSPPPLPPHTPCSAVTFQKISFEFQKFLCALRITHGTPVMGHLIATKITKCTDLSRLKMLHLEWFFLENKAKLTSFSQNTKWIVFWRRYFEKLATIHSSKIYEINFRWVSFISPRHNRKTYAFSCVWWPESNSHLKITVKGYAAY